MKLKSTFITHKVSNEHITVSTANAEFAGLVRSNKTAAFIIESLKEETTPIEITEELCKLYDADYNKVLNDVLRVIDTLRQIGAIDEQ